MKNQALWISFLAVILLAGAAQAYDVGDSEDFWVWDLSVMPPSDMQLSATCRGAGQYGYVFVEDAAWDAAEMDNTDVADILEAFEDASPAGSHDSDLGIYPIQTEVFGPVGDVDGDPKVVLLYYNLSCFGDTCFDGLFRYSDLSPGANSNETEMLHLNIHDNDPAGTYMLGVVAHEFNHMIHTPMDPDDAMWFHEAVAEAAMVVCGYGDDAWLTSFKNQSSTSFWGEEHSVHYGAALVLGAYLYTLFGTDVADLVDDPANGLPPIEDAYAQVAIGDLSFFESLALAAVLDEIDGLDLSGLRGAYEVDAAEFSIERTLKAGSFHYAPFSGTTPFSFTIEGTNALLLFETATGEIEYERIDDGSGQCVSNTSTKGAGDFLAFVMTNDSTELDVLYSLTLTPDDSCGQGDDDDATDDDDDDGGEPVDEGDDDDDDEGGCGC